MLAKRHNNRHASRPRRQHVGKRQEFQGKGGQQQGMEPDEPPRHDHRGHVEQFISARPPERTQEQLEQIGRHGGRVGESYPLLCQNWGLEAAQKRLEHVISEYTDPPPNITPT
jgi:hypothetical protein